ncbi:hypothetical protein GGI25_000873 [Coemansia spiralis]|uniref:Association with the SNF1 complex (ASC) domain-containing protein n=2 Tax=Coemansia TaxID=4863 RepID=A0A9W8GDG9_9FUNG|nr:5'-AMP-activated protein kinase beta subunit, interation domain-containing protein [Coemansia spiralis]KAJ1994090.1 hypothetical protein EDC05_001760 [Coemansia umbellata]KAJ2623610.1 hypothetical protein GGI26_002248 [Coemansia sp. RSA 1358]KAJ2680280.1 hypothetical protein GGI25_000873 [Coemansia spiralis]
MGNTQSTEGDGGNRRHSGHHRTGSNAGAGANSGQGGGNAGAAAGGLSHRFSRRSKPAATAAVPMPTIQTPTGHDGSIPIHQSLQQHQRRSGGRPGVGPVDMQSPVVGSPLPDASMIPGHGGMASSRYGGGRGMNHMAMPETIPQTLPNQGGIAQMMAARKIGPEAGGRSPLSGISDDRIRGIIDGIAGVEIPSKGSGLAGSLSNRDAGDDIDGVFRQAKIVPTLIRWTEPGQTVYISGSFINWQYKIKLHENEGMFGVVVDLPVGTHCLKYIVDGKWRCSNRFIIAPDDDGNLVNYFKVEDVVKEEDQEKENNVEGLDAATLSNSPPGEYGTAIPDLAKIARESSNNRRNEPPLLPPHLNQVLLNNSEIRRDDPSVLPVPNHVVLNHLYACSIKDNVMAVSSTSRYRGKYMTTIYYKPVTTHLV